MGVCAAAAAPAAPDLDCGLPEGPDRVAHQSTDGVVDLAWSGSPDTARFTLQQAKPGASDEFVTRYQGSDRSSVLSGLGEGLHAFRVRAIDGAGTESEWSDLLRVEVRYMDRDKVRLLWLLGAVVVSATVGAILHGHLSHQRRPQP